MTQSSSRPDHLAPLLTAGRVDIVGDALRALSPPPPLGSPGALWPRLEGMLLGLAIGDALGNTSESMGWQRRRQLHGEIRDYLPNRHAGGRAVGLPSDDTQLAFWTLEHYLEHGHLDPDRLARRFTAQRIFGIGSATREFVRRYRDEQRPWFEAGVPSAGNGTLMRIASVIVPHAPVAGDELWPDVVLDGMITHNDATSLAASIAFVSMLWALLGMTSAPEPWWWADAFVATAAPLEGDTRLRTRAASGPWAAYEGSLPAFVARALPRALAEGLDTRTACDEWYSGAFLLETVPSVLHILARHAHDPEEAIVRAVNDTRDNDTIAAIVGAAVGALHGRDALPPRWIGGLLGRTAESDDGAIFELLARARRRWGPPVSDEDDA